MSNIVALKADIRAVASFLTREAEALGELLRTVGEFDAAIAVLDIAKAVEGSDADAQRIADALGEVRRALEELPFHVIEDIARWREGPRGLHAAVRWYGARIADLEKRLSC